MRRITVVLALALLSAPTYAQPSASDLARAKRILRGTPLIDGHNDLAWAIRRDSTAPLDVAAYDLRKRTRGHTDLDRLTKGMVGGQFWSVYVPGEVKDSGFARIQLEQIDIARRFIEMYPERFQLALDAGDIRNAFRRKRIGSVIGMEGGHVLENSLGTLRAYHALGARYMTLTHNVTLDWADAASDSARHGGLTEFGKEVVREMNRLGMLVDLSHTSPATMSDALDVAEAPVIFSHSNARALADVPRNVPDSILRRLPRNGGVVMVTFVPGFITTAPGGATLSQVADHIEHIRRVAGADHVGIGGDFDGISVVVKGLEDVSTYPALFAELVRRGWPDSDLRKLAGENILRVMDRAESAAARLQRSRPPSVKTIQQLDAP
jgi:membrane dipeptidase